MTSIDYNKLEQAHHLAEQYQLLHEDDVSISVIFRSNYPKYQLVSNDLDEEAYTNLDGVINRLKELVKPKNKLTEWETHVAQTFQFKFPTASADDWRIIAKVIEEQMEKLGMLKKVETYQKSQGAWLGSLVNDMFPPAEITSEEQSIIDRHSKIHHSLFELQCDVDRKMAELPALKQMMENLINDK